MIIIIDSISCIVHLLKSSQLDPTDIKKVNIRVIEKIKPT